MFEYMRTVLNGLKAWVTGEVNKLLSKIDNDIAALRKTLDEASSNFVINAMPTSDLESITLDKTFAQIQEAINAGKRAIAKMIDVKDKFLYLPLYYADTKKIIFGSVASTASGIEILRLVVNNQNLCTYLVDYAASLNPNGSMPPTYMESNPIDDMEIATKKYVDDKCILKSTTPESTKKFKITVDDTGTLSATEVTG